MTTLKKQLMRQAQEIAELRLHGGILANIAFNLAQRSALGGEARRSLDEARRAWDACVERHAQSSHAGTPR